MKVKLVRHHLADRADWIVIKEDVPIGTIYEVWGYHSGMTLHNFFLKESRIVEAFLITRGNGLGYLPTSVFEVVKEE